MALEARAFTAPGAARCCDGCRTRGRQQLARWLLLLGSICLSCGVAFRRGEAAVSAGLVLAGVSYRYAGALGRARRRSICVLEPGRVVATWRGPQRIGQVDALPVVARLTAERDRRAAGRLGPDRRRRDGSTRPHAAGPALRAAVPERNPRPTLEHDATVLEEVAFGPCNLGCRAAEGGGAGTGGPCARLGSSRWPPRDPARLSGGQGQLVALASVLALGRAIWSSMSRRASSIRPGPGS